MTNCSAVSFIGSWFISLTFLRQKVVVNDSFTKSALGTPCLKVLGQLLACAVLKYYVLMRDNIFHKFGEFSISLDFFQTFRKRTTRLASGANKHSANKSLGFILACDSNYPFGDESSLESSDNHKKKS